MGLAFPDSSFLDWVGFLEGSSSLAVWWCTSTSSALALQKAQLILIPHNKNRREHAVLSVVRHHRSLESPATAICRDTVSETPRQYSKRVLQVTITAVVAMIFTSSETRHVKPPVWGSKPQFRPALGPYRTEI